MLRQLPYGENATLALDVPASALVADCLQPRGAPLEDAAAAVQAALAAPLDFPPLASSVLPDDRVVIALEAGLACAPELASGVVEALVAGGATPERIAILRGRGDRVISSKRLLADLPATMRKRIQVVEHDPTNRENLSYLAASKNDQPIYINRELFDADLVIPVGAWRTNAEDSRLGVHQSWFPAFADRATQRRFLRTQATLSRRQHGLRRRECEEAAWLLGIQLSVHIVPAGDNRALHVLAGAPEAVWKRGRELAEEAWRFHVARRASLVVAAIGGGPEQHTWENVARTLSMALEAVEENGAIAICTQLKVPPGPALRRLGQAGSYEAADRAIRRRPTADAPAAARLNRALQRSRVYLLSELDATATEQLGLAYIDAPAQIARLSCQHATCLVLGNAQHVALSVDSHAEAGGV